jgi:dTDP-4-dehydrorhamnose 3,5-epimerase
VTGIVELSTRPTAIDGLIVVTMKQVTDERGTVREYFRGSAFDAAGVHGVGFAQVNVTESHRGAIRGLHAEEMTKLIGVVAGRAFGAYVDLRDGSPTRGVVVTVDLEPGTQVLVPSGVANGFQALEDRSQYLYCFDQEWQPGMAGRACNPLDPDLAIPWPLPVDVDDRSQISAKDMNAPTFRELTAALGNGADDA